MNRRKLSWIAGLALLVVAVVAVAYVMWRAGERREIAAASVPPIPPLPGRPPELEQRLRACSARARSGSGTLAGLSELSSLYHANGFFSEAGLCYQGLLRIDPSNPKWPHRFASILAGSGDLDDAIALWRRTVDLAGDHLPAQIRLADALLKRNRPDDAAKIYGGVLKRESENPYALVGLARIDVDRGDWSRARERLEAAVARSDYNVGYDLLVTVCEQLGDVRRAKEIRARHKASGAFFDVPDPWLREIYFDCFDGYQLSIAGGTAAREGDLSTGLTLVERAVSYEPANPYYRIQAAGLYEQAGNTEAARRHLQTATTAAPECSDAWQNLVRLLTTMGRTQEAEQVLASGLSHCPESAGLHYVRGRRLAAAERFEEAIPDFQKAAAILNDDARPSFELASVYFHLDRNADALAALQRALIAEPDDPSTLSTLAFFAISSANEAGARKWMEKVRDQPRIQDQTRLALARAFQQQFGLAP